LENSTHTENESGCLPDFIGSWHCFKTSNLPALDRLKKCQTVGIPSAKQLPLAMSVPLENMCCAQTANVFLKDRPVLSTSSLKKTDYCKLYITCWKNRCSMQYSFEKRQPSSTVLFLLNTCNWDAQYIAWWASGPFHVAWEQPSAKVSHELGSWPNRQLKINREKDKTNVLYVYKYTWILHKIGHPDNIYVYIYMHMIIYIYIIYIYIIGTNLGMYQSNMSPHRHI
jgi:hypothetical protein